MSDAIVQAPAFRDANGSLYVFDVEQLPFAARRVFFVRAPEGSMRGNHAHRTGQQFLAVAAGQIDVTTTDLTGNRVTTRLRTGQGLHLPALVWATQAFVAPDSVLLVLCDLAYDEGDYIRDEEEFESLSRKSTAND